MARSNRKKGEGWYLVAQGWVTLVWGRDGAEPRPFAPRSPFRKQKAAERMRKHLECASKQTFVVVSHLEVQEALRNRRSAG